MRLDLARGGRLKSIAELVEALGSDVLVHFGLDAEPALVQSSDSLKEIKSSERRSRAVARLNSRTHVQIGSLIEVVVDVEHMQFFDPKLDRGDLGLTRTISHHPTGVADR